LLVQFGGNIVTTGLVAYIDCNVALFIDE